MSVAGIDFSTWFVDVVLLDEDDPRIVSWHRFPLVASGDGFDRARTVRDAMPSRGWWEDAGVVAIGIEQPFGRGSSVTPLYRVQGGILQCLPPALLVQPWAPSAWRKAVGLSGNATKDDVKQAVNAQRLRSSGAFRLPDDVWPQDACDAYCIARATRAVIEIGEAA